jgi:SPP1 gp7 family putative phage head morphogenesis protein
LPLDAVVRFWLPNFDRADEPGPPPGLTALNAARVLANKDSFIAAYFGRGAVKSVLLQVPPDSKPADRDRLTSWWRGLTSGVRNAWRSVVIQSSVTPVIIGDGLKDMNNESLTREYRQEVAAAFGIPETMLLQAAANFATAKTDRIGFYEETVFPEVWRLVEAINTQWLTPAYGAELVPQPDLTEERQGAQLQQAEAITALVGQPVMTLNEGRAWLGLDPLPEGNDVAPDEATVTKALRDERTTIRLRHATERRAAPSAAARVRLVRRQAEEREALSVKHTLLSDSPAIKAAKLTPEEKKLAKELEPILDRYGKDAVNAVLEGRILDTSKLSEATRAALMQDLTQAAMRAMLLSAEEVGMAVDAAAVSTRASEWARTATYPLVRGLDATTRAGLQSTIAAFLETPGMDRDYVTQLLAPIFGPQRAEVIAVTEITRAAAEGVKLTQQELRAAGLSFERIWRTAADERTCPVCSALNGKPEREWGGVEPPAHPWCRCATTLRRVG